MLLIIIYTSEALTYRFCKFLHLLKQKTFLKCWIIVGNFFLFYYMYTCSRQYSRDCHTDNPRPALSITQSVKQMLKIQCVATKTLF